MQMKKIEKNNIIKNSFFRYLSISCSILLILIFFLIVIFILTLAIDGFKNFGFINILFQGDFNENLGKYSFWIPFSVTLITSFIALLFAVPLGIKIAIFTKFRLRKKYQKYVSILFQTLSGIPSVIFGLFAVNSLGILFQNIFKISANSIFTSSIMLAFMVIPTIVSLTLDSLNSINDALYLNPIALGNTKTKAIYKIAKKSVSNGIAVAVVIALSRAFGESMAVSMILQATPNNNLYNGDFWHFLNASNQSIGAYISTAMFSDSDPDKIRPLLYAFGFIMLFFSMIINSFIFLISKKRKNKKYSNIFSKIEKHIVKVIYFIPNNIKYLFEKISFFGPKISKDNLESVYKYIDERNKRYKFKWIYSTWKLFWEWFSIIIALSFLVWIIGDILIKGGIGSSHESYSLFHYAKNSISQSFVNTLLIIFVCLLIGFPIALFCGIYLNEYAKNKKIKNIFVFFLDSLGTTPSIIFGMFGLLFFIETFGWTSVGKMGNSLIAGALTLILVILPTFIRQIEQGLKNVPNEIRFNSYALGNTKWQTIRKLVLPIAFFSIINTIISIIGRIFSETAPLYLTAGLSSSMSTALDRPGTTLTTHIYAQIFSTLPNSLDIQYSLAFTTLIIIFFLVFIGYIILPNWKNIKKEITNWWNLLFKKSPNKKVA